MPKPHWLWIPGWGMNADGLWQELWDALPEGIHHTVELRDAEEPRHFLDAVIGELQRHEPATEWYIVGWSMGSLLAVEAAAHREIRLKGLILIGGTARFCHPQAGWGWAPRIIERMKRRLPSSADRVVHDFLQGLFTSAELQDPRVQSWINHQGDERAWPLSALQAGLDYLLETDTEERLKSIRAPILLLHGEKDPICPWLQMEEMAKKLPTATSSPFSEAGHVPFVTNTNGFITELRAFQHETNRTEAKHSEEL